MHLNYSLFSTIDKDSLPGHFGIFLKTVAISQKLTFALLVYPSYVSDILIRSPIASNYSSRALKMLRCRKLSKAASAAKAASANIVLRPKGVDR